MNLSDFFLKGYIEFYEPDLDTQLNIPEYLGNKYLKSLFIEWSLVEFQTSDIIEQWDRITEWHNDSKFVGCNVTFFYYKDEMSPDIGGSISIRNGIYENKIYPKCGTLILMSQQSGVEHKAEYCTSRRRMYNIDFLVKGL